jgi:hypothetical protein
MTTALDLIYDTGTIAVANGATTVFGTGVMWDDFVDGLDTLETSVGSARVLSVNAGFDQITLVKPWPWATVTHSPDNYILLRNSPLRTDGVDVAEHARDALRALTAAGIFIPVESGGTPDPGDGDENQWALDPSTGALWRKISGVWVSQTSLGAFAHIPGGQFSVGNPAVDTALRTYTNDDRGYFNFYQAQNLGGSSAFHRALDIVSGIAGTNSSIIRFLNAKNSAAPTESARIDELGNFGIGAAPDWDLHTKKSVSGGAVRNVVENTSNTSGAHARLIAITASASAGDPVNIWDNNSVFWTAGLDSSDSGKWKLSYNDLLGGSGDKISMTTAGLMRLHAYGAGYAKFDANGNVTSDSAITGGWSNVRLAKTAAYTVANGDKSKTIALAGSAFYSLTFSTASGYDADFAVAVVNEDTTRGKTIVLTGGTNVKLMPEQSCFIHNDNNVWKVLGLPNRWKLSSDTQFHVHPSSGADTNDGLASGSGAFLTQQGCANYIANNVDANGKQIVVQLADATYTDQVFLPNVIGAVPGGWSDSGTYGLGLLCWRGNLSTPASCVQSHGGPSTKLRNIQTGWRVEGFKFTGGGGIQAEMNSFVYIGVNIFDCSEYDITVNFKSSVEYVAVCATTDRTRYNHIQLLYQCHLICASGSGILATGSAPTYSGGAGSFIDVQWGSQATMDAFGVDASMSGTVGYKATVARGSTLSKPVSATLPGSIAITADSASFGYSN